MRAERAEFGGRTIEGLTMAEMEMGEPVPIPDERDWLPRHASGDETAFAELLAAYRRPVYAFLVRSGLSTTVRDDLFQEIFLKIHVAADRYQPSRPLKPWLFTIVANTVRSYFRKATSVVVYASELVDDHADDAPTSEAAAAARQTVRWLEGAIVGLPEAQREVILLSCVEGMNQKEVGAALQIPVNTVKTHLRRGRLTLARLLAEREAPEALGKGK